MDAQFDEIKKYHQCKRALLQFATPCRKMQQFESPL
jgi:hypothetical protein